MKRIVVALSVLALVAGCSTDDTAPAPTQTPAAEPARAPAAQDPIGTVVPLPGAPEGIVVTSSGIAVAAVREPDGLRLLDAATGVERSFVPTVGAPRHLSLAGPDGPVLAPLESSDELLLVDPANGATLSTTRGVGRQPHDAVVTADGATVVTNEMGGGVVFVRNGVVIASLPAGPVQPGGVAAVGNYAAVADVQGNGIWIYSGPDQKLVAQGPLGTKLTHATSLGPDLAAFADTDGGAVYLERITPDISEVARIDAPGNPYGLAYDADRKLLLITLTESNILRVVDVAEPASPRIVVDLPTVRQANSVAVDPRTGNVLVTGSDPGADSSLQIIPADSVDAS
ncbi:hypothetical protein [Rhodococcus sp. SORGH_AS_0303]|uniref:hypothetical protein n=1 Tax=Rhodococcus sp. SORGH_AS_0303 TaxID=3041753 RepID=UPI00277D1C46|nr:hypothetical protein [Rhodococcus sp. SORGH_AS_0303]MDQ1203128.1 YD repeat-containing protein [Rhodococcus sp. SORGH_AS_0303]